jgi:hypothetical protein
MSLVFHNFPDTKSAEAFVFGVKQTVGLGGRVFATTQAAYNAEPWRGLGLLTPPIVRINRPPFIVDPDGGCYRGGELIEEQVELAAASFGGEFAGT